MIDNSKEYILCAAIWFDDNIKHVHQPKNIETGFVVCGRRHHNCFATLYAIGEEERFDAKFCGHGVQGFITSKDMFLDRRQASELAIQCNQITEQELSVLISEDLY